MSNINTVPDLGFTRSHVPRPFEETDVPEVTPKIIILPWIPAEYRIRRSITGAMT